MSFREEVATVRQGNAPQNLSLRRKIVLNLAGVDTADPFKGGASKRRECA